MVPSSNDLKPLTTKTSERNDMPKPRKKAAPGQEPGTGFPLTVKEHDCATNYGEKKISNEGIKLI